MPTIKKKKAIYATTETGGYGIVASSGWEVEEEAIKLALKELERLSGKAYGRVVAGEVSPLYFQTYGLQVLAQVSGIFKWRPYTSFQADGFCQAFQKAA